ncbi:hypothetical protein [Streptomyces sp. CA-253872]|uniref:hypothetical protein n=1 Tax=Streptomyces sp. CA-253872 TaxID=3240067 RepID=UPI003D8CA95C
MASRTRDFFRSLKPGNDVQLASELERSAQERDRKADAKRQRQSRERAQRHKRSLPPLG